jgi:hypothetical protein
MAAKNCVECGAELQLSSNSCPLCGAEREESVKWTVSKKKVEPVEPAELEDYQASVRELHEQLRKIRDDGAQAV